jgi:hypothetical protein
MPAKTKAAADTAAPETEIEKAAEQFAAERDAVPEYTIRADSQFGLFMMIRVAREAVNALPPDEQTPVFAKLREFELYHENHQPVPVVEVPDLTPLEKMELADEKAAG